MDFYAHNEPSYDGCGAWRKRLSMEDLPVYKAVILVGDEDFLSRILLLGGYGCGS